MYEVYSDMLRRNEEIGMSDLDLQGPTSFHTRMDTIRPKVSQCEKLDVNAGLSMFDNQGTVGIRMSTRFRKAINKIKGPDNPTCQLLATSSKQV